MVAWLATIAMHGVFTAVPIKRQLINVEELPFPTGTATAATLQALHGQGGEAARRARKLGWAAAFGAALAFVRDLRWPSASTGGWRGVSLPLDSLVEGASSLRSSRHTAGSARSSRR